MKWLLLGAGEHSFVDHSLMCLPTIAIAASLLSLPPFPNSYSQGRHPSTTTLMRFFSLIFKFFNDHIWEEVKWRWFSLHVHEGFFIIFIFLIINLRPYGRWIEGGFHHHGCVPRVKKKYPPKTQKSPMGVVEGCL